MSSGPLPPDALAAQLSLAVGQLLRRLRAEASPDGLTLSQTMALARLGRDGPSTIAALARAEAIRPQSMGTTLAELEAAGLVARRPHPTDGRQVLFALTPEGEDMRTRRNAAKQKWLLATLERLSPEERAVLQSALPLLRHIGESQPAAQSPEARPQPRSEAP